MNDRPPKGPPLFRCEKLSCWLSREACVARQRENERRASKRSADRPWELARHDGKRGVVPEFPTCLPQRCSQGRRIRVRLEPSYTLPAPTPAVLRRRRRERRSLARR